MSKTVETNYGKFIQNYLEPVKNEKGQPVGANIYMEFEPGDRVVAAKKIGIVQMARSTKNGKPFVDSPERKQKMVKGKGPGAGSFIDQDIELANPIYATGDQLLKGGKEDQLEGYKDDEIRDARQEDDDRDTDYGQIAGRKYAGFGTYGYSYGDSKQQPQKKNATFQDTPHIYKVHRNSSQLFETSALVIENPPGLAFQKGLYLGSVSWGWTRKNGQFEPQSIELVSKGAPSEQFFNAAQVWNDSKTNGGKETVDLPMSTGKIKNDKTPLYHQEKDIGTDTYTQLTKDAPCRIVTTLMKPDSMYFLVRCTDSSQNLIEGWVKDSDVTADVFQK